MLLAVRRSSERRSQRWSTHARISEPTPSSYVQGRWYSKIRVHVSCCARSHRSRPAKPRSWSSVRPGPARRQPSEPASPAAPAGFAPLERALLPLFERGGTELYEKIASAVVIQAYDFCHDNQVQTANLLGISRNVLRARLAMSGLIAGRRDKKHGVPSAPTVSTHPR